jgi:hypothetical protein
VPGGGAFSGCSAFGMFITPGDHGGIPRVK